MLSDVSSLSSLSSSEGDDYVETKAKKPRPWQLKQVLKPPRAVQFSTDSLYEDILNGRVDLDPEYQRDVVWADAKQTGLIDSLMRNFYIPPVVFALHVSDDGEEKRICIDGKQRLTSIQRFMDGQIPYKDPESNLKLWYKLQPGSKGRLLPEQYRSQFARKQLVCIEYTDITDNTEREIFQRVQMGVALTPAERLQAIASPWSQLVREVLTIMNEYKMGEHMDWLATRGRDFHCVAASIYLLDKQLDTYPAVSTLEKWLSRVTPPTKIFKERVLDSFAVFRQLVLDKKLSSIFQPTTRISPIEFVMCVVLIDTYMKDITLSQLALGIYKMRENVRSEHIDIRANSKVTKTMFAFVKNKLPSILKKTDKKSNEKPALVACRANPILKPKDKAKRKREDDSSDLESEASSEEEMPIKTTLKAPVKIIKQNSAASKGKAPKPENTLQDKNSELWSTKERHANKPSEISLPSPNDMDDPTIMETTQRILNRNTPATPQQYEWPAPTPIISPTQNSFRLMNTQQSPIAPSYQNTNGLSRRPSDPNAYRSQPRQGPSISPRLPPPASPRQGFYNSPHLPPRGPNSPDPSYGPRPGPNDLRGRERRNSDARSPRMSYRPPGDWRR